MKKRVFAGLLLAFMLMFSVVPCFAEPAEDAVVEEAPVEEAPAEEAPAEEAPVEDVPAEQAAPEPEASKFGAADWFVLTEATYDNEAGTISITYENTSEINQGIPWIVLDFDTTKITVTPDMQNIMDASIASQAGIDMEDGVIVLVQKSLEAGKKHTVKFDAKVVDYKEGALPEVALRIFTQTLSDEIDLTAAAQEKSDDLKVQKFENIFVNAEGSGFGSSLSAFVEENLTLVVSIAYIAIIILFILLIASILSKGKKGKDVEIVEEADASDEFTQTSLASQDAEADDVEEVADEEDGGQEDEEV